MTNKKKILIYGDSPLVATGFSRVVREIVGPLWKTGEWDITQVGINYLSTLIDRTICPWELLPAITPTFPKDYLGLNQMVSLLSKKWDYIFIVNDIFVVYYLKEYLKASKAKKVFYFPVDSDIPKEYKSLFDVIDTPVAYTNYANKQVGISAPVIYHGTDIKTFYPISSADKQSNKLKLLKNNNFLIFNNNRNQPRKAIYRTLEAFAEFHKKIPASTLYLHTETIQKEGSTVPMDNIAYISEQLGLQYKVDVITPKEWNPNKNCLTDEQLNMYYNISDCFLTTTLGEGFGLTPAEAMASGCPVVAPNSTVFPELIGDYGYLFDCKDKVSVDNSGLRPIGRVEDIVEQLLKVYQLKGTPEMEKKLRGARQVAESRSWEIINKEWAKIFV